MVGKYTGLSDSYLSVLKVTEKCITLLPLSFGVGYFFPVYMHTGDKFAMEYPECKLL